MTKADVRKQFIELRDNCKNPKFEIIGDMRFSKGKEYSRIYSVLKETGNFDVDYMEHLKGKNGYQLAANPGKLTFKECCTVLTFLLRAERFSQGAFTNTLSNGSVYKLLSRAVEVM